ncbi:GlmU N-acetylglucosamine-1-phosphate uridyltransferase (contains nucleotidyltransferase and I-patch acetyltransferase domains) [Rhabdaerophilaceae bacterium]
MGLHLSRATRFLFDFDGTIAHSPPLHERAFKAVLAEHHPGLLPGFDYHRFVGMETTRVFRLLGLEADAAALAKAKRAAYEALVLAGKLSFMPGAEDCLRRLTALGMPLYLGTSGSRGSVTRAMQALGIEGLFAGIVFGDEVSQGKPHPEIFTTLMAQYGIDPADAVVVEDALSGVKAARAADASVIGVFDEALASEVDWFVTNLSDIAARVELANSLDVAAVIPAAGKGTRLGLDKPKILADVTPHDTIWSILRDKLRPIVDQVSVVMSPWGRPYFAEALRPEDDGTVRIAIQDEPIGMGDAVFRARRDFANAHRLLVVWGDQVNVSPETLRSAIAAHAHRSRTVIVPVVRLAQPYVEYRFEDGRLTRILETREGDICAPNGYGDVGVFLLSVPDLESAWGAYLGPAKRGAATGEINFLPFMTYLAGHGWTVEPIEIDDPVEARGINNKDDLAYAALHVERLKGHPAPASKGQKP